MNLMTACLKAEIYRSKINSRMLIKYSREKSEVKSFVNNLSLLNLKYTENTLILFNFFQPHPEKNYNWEFLQKLDGKYHWAIAKNTAKQLQKVCLDVILLSSYKDISFGVIYHYSRIIIFVLKVTYLWFQSSFLVLLSVHGWKNGYSIVNTH